MVILDAVSRSFRGFFVVDCGIAPGKEEGGDEDSNGQASGYGIKLSVFHNQLILKGALNAR
jgi:hypothetical protein